MLTLLIETSTERGVVAILKDRQIVAHVELPFGYSNSTYLIPTIDKQLKEHHLAIKDFGLIVTGVGPGSYTGIRVGATVAKTFAYACKIPLVGVCSLEGFCPCDEGPFAALIDAKMGGAYVLKGVHEQGHCTYTSEPKACPLEELQLDSVKTIVTPSGATLKEKLPNGPWKWEEKAPDPLQLVERAIHKMEAGCKVDPEALELMYLRKTQAEIEREQKLSKDKI